MENAQDDDDGEREGAESGDEYEGGAKDDEGNYVDGYCYSRSCCGQYRYAAADRLTEHR